MTSIISLTAERTKRDAPDADCIRSDSTGNQMQIYALEYRFNDRRCEAEIWAYSMQDAQSRVAAVRDSLTLIGQTVAVVG